MERKHNLEEFNFNKYWQIIKYHKIPAIGVFLVTCIIATIMAINTEKKYAAEGKIKFTKESFASSLVTEAGKKLGTLDTFTGTSTPVDTEAEVLVSSPIINQVIEELDLKNEEGEALTYEDVSQSLAVENIPGTDVLNISYVSKDGEEAQAVVDSVIKAYIAYEVETNRAQAKSAKDFISKQLPETEEELKIAEANLRSFQERYGLVDLDAETEQTVVQIGTIDEQITTAKARLEKVKGLIQEAELKLGVPSEEALALNTINDSPIVQQITLKLKEVEDRLALERSRFQEGNPVIVSLEAQKQELEKELETRVRQSLGNKASTGLKLLQQQTGDVTEILTEKLVGYEVERQSLEKEINSLEQSKSDYRQRANLLPQLEQRHRDLVRKVNASQTAYNTLLNNLQQVQIITNQNVGNAQVIGDAIASKYPVSLSPKFIIAGGMGLGGVLGLLSAFLLELRNPSCKTTQELRQTYRYKLLATTPNQQSQNLLGFTGLKAFSGDNSSIADEPYSIASESYRILHTNLQFLNENDVKVITVTSSIPKEGKSTVSANLAASLAQIKKKVLIIDADLHRPQQHSMWGISNRRGLAEILRDEAIISETIQQVTPYIHVIPSGLAQPGESLMLLQSRKIENLIERIKRDYDLVIFDTPPVLLFADALTVAGQTEGIVFIARPGVTSPASAASSKELLEQSGQQVLGLVVNGVTEESDSYYRYAKNYYQKDSAQLRLPQKIS
jgi:polysaccharide biosynthesis transport protein